VVRAEAFLSGFQASGSRSGVRIQFGSEYGHPVVHYGVYRSDKWWLPRWTSGVYRDIFRYLGGRSVTSGVWCSQKHLTRNGQMRWTWYQWGRQQLARLGMILQPARCGSGLCRATHTRSVECRSMCLMLFWLLDPKANIMTPIFVIGINA